jgi:hypothetical protein
MLRECGNPRPKCDGLFLRILNIEQSAVHIYIWGYPLVLSYMTFLYVPLSSRRFPPCRCHDN